MATVESLTELNFITNKKINVTMKTRINLHDLKHGTINFVI